MADEVHKDQNVCQFCNKKATGFSNNPMLFCDNCSDKYHKLLAHFEEIERRDVDDLLAPPKVKRFTIEEIEAYLDGFHLIDGNGKPLDKENTALGTAISLLHDDEDGIEAVSKRHEAYRLLGLEK
jgi:hypothetical protein